MFDDFAYEAAADYVPSLRRGRRGTIFGLNDWLTGNPGERPQAVTSRAWYATYWVEWHGWYRTLFENDDDYFLRTEQEANGQPSRVAMGTEGYLVRRPAQGGLEPLDMGPSLRSGFTARTGVWMVRARLPDFDGLRFHGPTGDGERIGMLVAPIWTQSSWALEARPEFRLASVQSAWYEWNFEINNTRRLGDPQHYRPTWDATPPMSVGQMWSLGGEFGRATQWGDLAYGSPVLGEQQPQHCRLTTDAGVQRVASPPECFGLLTGTSSYTTADGDRWRPFVYFVARITPTRSTYYLFVRDEDDLGHPRLQGAGHVSGFRTMTMTTPEYVNYVTPQAMSSFLSLFFDCEGSTPCTVGRDNAKMLEVDWFLYSPETGRTVEGMIDDVGVLKRYLDSAGDRGRAPRRLNMVRYRDAMAMATLSQADGFVRLDNGYTQRPSEPDPCQPGIERPLRPSQPFDFAVEARRAFFNDGGTADLLQPVMLESTVHRIRHAHMRVTWWIDPFGSATLRDSVVSDRGFVLRLNPRHLGRGADIRVRVEQVHETNGGWVRAEPACGAGAGDRLVRERRYRYDARSGQVTEQG